MSVLSGVLVTNTKNIILSFCTMAFIHHKVFYVLFMYQRILLVLFCRVKEIEKLFNFLSKVT